MVPGQVSISARALQRVVTAIAASELDVPSKDVSVQLSDDRGLLAVAVTAPLRLAPLRVPGLGASSAQPGILRRCDDARAAIRSRTHEITGSEVRTVDVRITRARILAASRIA